MSLAPIYSFVKPYLVFAITPVHAGVGRGLEEHADLPVQRDSLGIPCIWGSSIKGALRTAFRQGKGNKLDNVEKLLFGPERERAHEHAGALNILDAKLFLCPISSLKCGFALVTTKVLLERARALLELAGIVKEEKLRGLVNLLSSSGKTLVSSNDLTLDGKVWLGDKVFEVDAELTNDVKVLLEDLLKDIKIPLSIDTVSNRIVILQDADGLQLLSRATTSITRTALDYQRKTVKEGALWDEEYVPDMSMFITAILISNPRSEPSMNAEQLFKELMSTLKSRDEKDFFLVLGGHETIGKGIVKFCGW
jgi:CRISPR-associated protein Cmr4